MISSKNVYDNNQTLCHGDRANETETEREHYNLCMKWGGGVFNATYFKMLCKQKNGTKLIRRVGFVAFYAFTPSTKVKNIGKRGMGSFNITDWAAWIWVTLDSFQHLHVRCKAI